MSGTAANKPTLPTFDSLKARAGVVTIDNYDQLLTDVAVQTVSGVLDDIQQARIIAAMADNKALGGGKSAINKALKAKESSLHRDNQAERVSGRITGGYGDYSVLQDRVNVYRKTQFGINAQPDFVCSALRVTAETFDTDGDNRGLRLEWTSTEGRKQSWLMPVDLTAGDGMGVIRALLAKGLQIAAGNEKFLIDYIRSAGNETSARLTCTDKTGWLQGSFVTPTATYGDKAEEFLFQTQHAVETGYSQQGTLEDWKRHIAAKALDNPRLMLAIASAFTGALLNKAGIPGFGIHFWGGSSIGKTTLLLLASSVWGRPKRDSNGQGGYMRQWLTTAVGVEGTACAYNDGLLVLDELGEATARTVSGTAYMLGNGMTKVRGNRDGNAKTPRHFKLVFLSSGEHTLDHMIKAEGGTTRAGQEIRMVHLQADAGEGHGIFNTLHGAADGSVLAESLNDATGNYYGAVGIEWLKAITGQDGIPDDISRAVNVIRDGFLPANASGQVQRVARQFALIAYAGQLATQYGLTGWGEQAAISAAKGCFDEWLADFGGATGQRENTQIISAVDSFFIRNGDKFQEMRPDGKYEQMSARDRVGGYRMNESGDKEYIVPTTEVHRLAEGYDSDQIIKALSEADRINLPGSVRKATQVRFFGGRAYCYVIQGSPPDPINEEPDF